MRWNGLGMTHTIHCSEALEEAGVWIKERKGKGKGSAHKRIYGESKWPRENQIDSLFCKRWYHILTSRSAMHIRLKWYDIFALNSSYELGSERANEWVQRSGQVKWAVWSKQISEHFTRRFHSLQTNRGLILWTAERSADNFLCFIID